MYQINNKGNWIALKKRIILAYPTITEADLLLNNGDDFNLLARLQNKFSKTKKEIITMIDKV
ncbi:MAG: hypothetical protein OQJ93_05305 [Ignavibacteriaceae bacterium]|jgi:hypothetical protein|nr:hypothetical protein [Ignavibacteriaceae bacterium]